MTSTLDMIVPLCTVQTRRRSSDPWFHRECRLTKRAVQQLERLALSYGTPEATDAWTIKRREYRDMQRQKRESVFLAGKGRSRAVVTTSAVAFCRHIAWSWVRPSVQRD